MGNILGVRRHQGSVRMLEGSAPLSSWCTEKEVLICWWDGNLKPGDGKKSVREQYIFLYPPPNQFPDCSHGSMIRAGSLPFSISLRPETRSCCNVNSPGSSLSHFCRDWLADSKTHVEVLRSEHFQSKDRRRWMYSGDPRLVIKILQTLRF